MRILVLYVHWPIAAGQHYARAFRRLGHQVITSGPILKSFDNATMWGVRPETWWPTHPLGEVYQAGRGYVQAEELLPLIDPPPDLIVTASGFFTVMGKLPCPHILISFEPPEYTDVLGKWDDIWDYEFAAHPRNPHLNNGHCEYLEMGYDPTLHVNRVPWNERPIPLSLVAHMHPKRLDFLKKLMETHWVVGSMGNTWEQYVTLTNAGRSTINYPLVPQPGVSNRCYEAMAMGAIYFDQPTDDMDKAGLIPEVHYLPYHTAGDVTDWLDKLASTPPEYGAAITNRARAWVAGKTYDARCQHIIDVMGGK